MQDLYPKNIMLFPSLKCIFSSGVWARILRLSGLYRLNEMKRLSFITDIPTELVQTFRSQRCQRVCEISACTALTRTCCDGSEALPSYR